MHPSLFPLWFSTSIMCFFLVCPSLIGFSSLPPSVLSFSLVSRISPLFQREGIRRAATVRTKSRKLFSLVRLFSGQATPAKMLGKCSSTASG